MPVHAAREHAATEAPARGGGDDLERLPTGFAQVDREACAPVLTNAWAASFMHGFNHPDTVRASNMPRTGSSPLSDVRGPVRYGQNMVARQKRGLADSTTAHGETGTSFAPPFRPAMRATTGPARTNANITTLPGAASAVPLPDHRDQLRLRNARP